MLSKRTMIAGSCALLVLTAGPAVAGCPPDVPTVPAVEEQVVGADQLDDKGRAAVGARRQRVRDLAAQHLRVRKPE